VLSLTAKLLAHLIGGDPLPRDSRGREGAQGPGPGHRPEDRSMVVRIDPTSRGGLAVSTFSPRDDWRRCKDYVREKLGFPPYWKPRLIRQQHTLRGATKSVGDNSAGRRLWEQSLSVPRTPAEPYLTSRSIVATEAIRCLPAKPPQNPYAAMIENCSHSEVFPSVRQPACAYPPLIVSTAYPSTAKRVGARTSRYCRHTPEVRSHAGER
jgi:hypothetical protein